MRIKTVIHRVRDACLAVAIVAVLAGTAAAREPKVLLIGIDGCRFDAIEAAEAPHLDALIAAGAYAADTKILGARYRGNDTISGPGWSSILTGVWADKHGVDDNEFKKPNYTEYPHFFRRVKQLRPDAYAISLVSWAPIHQYIDSGADVTAALAAPGDERYAIGDRLVKSETARLLADTDPTVVFAYFGNVDETGHKFGFHPSVKEYREAIEKVDAHVGDVLAATRGRKNYASEDWLILVTSDHGGQGTGHGGGHEIPEILNSFLVVSGGAAARGRIAEPTYLVDVVPTALAHLGLSADAAWKLDGRAKGLKTARLPTADPREVGMDPMRLARIDDAVAGALSAGRMPGCVVLVARDGKTVFQKAYGKKRLVPAAEPMTVDTVFDLASLTKPLATATSVMLLVERGLVRLDDKVAQHLPEFAAEGKGEITVEQLLVHQGGLIADNNLADYADGPKKAIERLLAIKPVASPTEKFIYSDVGFMVLGELVRRVSGQSVHEFSRQNLFRPLGLFETTFLPDEELCRRAAPTQERDGHWMQGQVHDPRAWSLGGVAGHAGLFSTAEEVAVFASALADGGRAAGTSILAPATVDLMTRARPVKGGQRGLGWDMKTGYSSNRGELMSERAFGHGGFTGTSLWIDPATRLVVVFLSNRVHPDGKGSVNPLAGRIGSIAAGAIVESKPRSSAVLTGAEVLRRESAARLSGRRVGLITNHTGVCADGRTTAAMLAAAPGVRLVALFSPEHGIEGRLDQSRIDDGRDAATGVPIYSLYGQHRRPTPESLRDLDTLVYDIQDVGARFYTYPATMLESMRAAAEHKLRFVVLDRPNPLGGLAVAGPLADAGKESFVVFHRVPVRHGMTCGELARLMNAQLGLGVDLEVVAVESWRRELEFDQTGLAWVNPSPNMRSLTAAVWYPGVGLLETTNISVGRGTERPFELVGAPWIDALRLTEALSQAGLPGASFVPVRFTPTASVHAGAACGGVQLQITDRRKIDPVAVGLEIAVQLRRLYPNEWKLDAYGRLLANDETLAALRAGKSSSEIAEAWRDETAAFLRDREPFLLYP